MSLLIFDHIDNAYRSLKRNKGRSVLTTLGIMIGVASVTTILALASGVTSMIDNQVGEAHDNLAIIRPGLQTGDPNAATSPVTQRTFSTSTLTEDDLLALGRLEGMGAIAPVMTIDGTLKAPGAEITNNVVLATTPSFAKVTDIPMHSGQFLDGSTDNDTVVIGYQLSIDLFGTDRPIGRTLTVRGQKLTVIGVMRKNEHPVNYNNVDLNRAVVVSFDRGKFFHQGRSQIQQINYNAKNPADLDNLTEKVRTTLMSTHSGEKDFSISVGRDISKPTNDLFVALSAVMTAIAAVSLVVGGIGIMNIMLVNVAERTREIGIRKAVGASGGAIVMQFLVESLMVSLLGGFLGYIFGYVLAFGISTFLYFTPTFNWLTAAAALIMSVGVGLGFGLYPALRAARKNTIESLRQYH